jgi:serine/threonine protein phosphatase PrpC
MGAYLDTPDKEKHSESGTNEICSWGASGMQGWRTGMEDEHIANEIMFPKTKSKGMLFGVFDGHGG